MLKAILLYALSLSVSFLVQVQNNSQEMNIETAEIKSPRDSLIVSETKTNPSTAEMNSVNEDLIIPDQMPVPGYNLEKYIKDNLIIPFAAIKYHQQGQVLIRYLITKECHVTNVTIVKGIGLGCEEEAKRVVESLPRFKSPAMYKGEPIEMWFTMPFDFNPSKKK